MKDKKYGIGLRYAIIGLLTVFKRERNFKIHLIALIIVFIAGILFNLTLLEWLIIILIVCLVLICEIFNSAIELLIDYIKPDQHPTAKVIKDMSAGAVLIAAIGAIIIGGIIFGHKIFTG